MNKNDVYDLIRLGQVLPKARAGDLVKLVYLARRLHRLYEHMCNGDLDLDLENKPTQNTEHQVKILTAHMPGVASVSFNRDPRTLPIRLKLRTRKGNTWDNGGWAI